MRWSAGGDFHGHIKVIFGPRTIRVEDNGRGIAIKDLPQIGRSGFTSRAATGGKGIGTSVAGKIMREFMGRMDITNRTGKETGACVTFTFHVPPKIEAANVASFFEKTLTKTITDPALRAQLEAPDNTRRISRPRILITKLRYAFSRGHLQVAPWKILANSAVVLLGSLLWRWYFPEGNLQVFLAGVVSAGLLLTVNYLPRISYLLQLARSQGKR